MATRARTYILKKFDGGGYVRWFYDYDKLKLVVKRDMVGVGSLWGLPHPADIELDAAKCVIRPIEDDERVSLEVVLFGCRPYILYVPISDVAQHFFDASHQSRFTEYLYKTDAKIRESGGFSEQLILPFVDDVNCVVSASNFIGFYPKRVLGYSYWGVRTCRPEVGCTDSTGEYLVAGLWDLAICPVNDNNRAAVSRDERRKHCGNCFWVKTPYRFVENLYLEYKGFATARYAHVALYFDL